jgi:hypothetical protein
MNILFYFVLEMTINNTTGDIIMEDNNHDIIIEEALTAASTTSISAHAVHHMDPSLQEIGDPCNLNNYLPDSGATQHMTPCLLDLINVVALNNKQLTRVL